MSKRIAIVMAAGKGTRMKSDLPKVLFPVLGRPMIEYVLDALEKVGVDRVLIVVGYRSELVRERLAHRKNLAFVEQTQQLGTGHAIMMCRESLQGHDGPVLIVAGDCPMLQPESLEKLFIAYQTEIPACVMGTAKKDNAFGLGRILRDENGDFLRIVEEKDATESEKAITEVNMSYYVFHSSDLIDVLGRLQTNNSQNEYYITDAPAILRTLEKRVIALPILKPIEGLGINTIEELAAVEKALA